MINEEYREELSKRFEQRYGRLEEYNCEVAKTAQNWLGEYLDFYTEDKVVEDPEATVKFIDKARDLIFRLLDEINRNGGRLTATQGNNPFEIIDGQVILHGKFQGLEADKVVFNHQQVDAIKLLLEALKDGKI